MEKYKNKNGIALNYTGNDSHQVLVREVIQEAIKILGMYDRSCKISMGMAMANTKKFLKTNFDIGIKSEKIETEMLNPERSDTWRINQFNRNRATEDQVTTIEELEKRVDEIFNA